MRGATSGRVGVEGHAAVSIHAPHARGDLVGIAVLLAREVSIHAPHARGDQRQRHGRDGRSWFQSTPLMRGATRASDARSCRIARFNPRPSCEGRLGVGVAVNDRRKFQSTPLMRGATGDARGARHGARVSIHAPHARGDSISHALPLVTPSFQSTPLMRGATWCVWT